MTDVPKDKITVKIGDRQVVLDPDAMVFNEASLSKYMESEHVWYDHFGQALSELEAEYQAIEVDYDALYGKKFAETKEAGASDKLADALTKADPEVVELRKKSVEAKKGIGLLKNHLRAWDKAHDNAQSRGHMIRKEMDKLNFGIMESKESQFTMEERLQGRN